MTRRVVVDGREFTVIVEEHSTEKLGPIKCTLLPTDNKGETYALSVVQIASGMYSVVQGTHSHVVWIEKAVDEMNVSIGSNKRKISLMDPRDRATVAGQGGRSGPSEIRSQMPGRIVRLLVQQGENVEAGQGIIVVEAMKMQNEVKSPKSARVEKIYVQEGDAVIAGQPLILVA